MEFFRWPDEELHCIKDARGWVIRRKKTRPTLRARFHRWARRIWHRKEKIPTPAEWIREACDSPSERKARGQGW